MLENFLGEKGGKNIKRIHSDFILYDGDELKEAEYVFVDPTCSSTGNKLFCDLLICSKKLNCIVIESY